MPSGTSYGVLGSVACNAAIDLNTAGTVCRTPTFGQAFKVTHCWAQLASGVVVTANTTITAGREKVGGSNTATNFATFVLNTTVNTLGDIVFAPVGNFGDTDLAPGESVRFYSGGETDASTWTFGVLGYEVPVPLPTNTATSTAKTLSGTGTIYYAASITEV